MARCVALPKDRRRKLKIFVTNSLKEHSADDRKNYVRLVEELSKTQPPNTIWNWLDIIGDLVRKFRIEDHSELIRALLEFNWNYPPVVLKKFVKFLLQLISAEPMYLRRVLHCAIDGLTIGEEEEGPEIAKRLVESKNFEDRCQIILSFLEAAAADSPGIDTMLFPIMLKHAPHDPEPIYHRCYISNFFRILQIFPQLRHRSTQYFLERVCLEDQKLLKRATFLEDADGNRRDAYLQQLEILDNLVEMLLQQIKLHSQNSEEILKTWIFVMKCFERSILKTQQSVHVQFILLYICQFQSAFARGFLERLLKMATNPSTPPQVRMRALRFVGGFISRAKYTRRSDAKLAIHVLCTWAWNYVMVASETREEDTGNIPTHEIENHQVFYVALESLYSIIIHRADLNLLGPDGMELEDEKKLSQIINSFLTPLKFCGHQLIHQFERSIDNSSLQDLITAEFRTLEGFEEPEFPYDQFLLDNSKPFFKDIYNDTDHFEEELDSS